MSRVHNRSTHPTYFTLVDFDLSIFVSDIFNSIFFVHNACSLPGEREIVQPAQLAVANAADAAAEPQSRGQS